MEQQEDIMMDGENIYNKIKEIFGYMSNNLNILEEQIDIDLQMEYFEFSKNLNAQKSSEEILEEKDKLFESSVSVEIKKKILVELASVEEIEAFRTIEKYLKNPDKELKDWATLSLQESKMFIESKLLDENQIFISTGLGGKGSKLRYFVVLISQKKTNFTVLQKKVINSEFDFTLKKYDGEIEEIKYAKTFCTIKAVIPLNVSIKEVFKEALDECNQYGNFLEDNFIVTNMKELSFEEIEDFLEKEKYNENT